MTTAVESSFYTKGILLVFVVIKIKDQRNYQESQEICLTQGLGTRGEYGKVVNFAIVAHAL